MALLNEVVLLSLRQLLSHWEQAVATLHCSTSTFISPSPILSLFAVGFVQVFLILLEASGFTKVYFGPV